MEKTMSSKLQWEGYYDRHAWLDNGLHLRVTRIDIPLSGDYFWMWTVEDPMIRVAVASSHIDHSIQDIDEAERQCIEAAQRTKPYGG